MFRKKHSNKYKLVTLGDSLTQGFKNGGIYRTDLSYPAFLARCFEPSNHFDQPLFTAQTGIPVNLEMLIRDLEDRYGSHIEMGEYLSAGRQLYTTVRRIKNYWEGNMRSLRRNHPEPFQNQSVWGFAVNDSWLLTEKTCRNFIRQNPPQYSVFSVLPDHAMYITARCVLNPTFGKEFEDFSLIDNIRHLDQNGGIENLLINLGNNNIIGAPSDLRIKYSELDDLEALPSKRNYTVYRPEHFRQDFESLAKKLKNIHAERIFVSTIPYVTIPPVTRGINEDLSLKHSGYFDYYTRFWIWDEDFDPEEHPHLTKEQAIELDLVVDEYNRIIREVAGRNGWIVVPMNKYVSAIASRRRSGNIRVPFPEGLVEALKRNPRTQHLAGDPHTVQLSTDYLRLDEETGKLRKGGIFSLDGIHPTTIGYGLMAHVFYETMQEHGVEFASELDWDHVVENDSLVTDPPHLMVELRSLLRFLSMGHQERITNIGRNLLAQMLDLFSPSRSEAIEREDSITSTPEED